MIVSNRIEGNGDIVHDLERSNVHVLWGCDLWRVLTHSLTADSTRFRDSRDRRNKIKKSYKKQSVGERVAIDSKAIFLLDIIYVECETAGRNGWPEKAKP